MSSGNKIKKILIKFLRSSQKCRGFTLVEMLVTIVVFSLIVLIVMGGFSNLYKSYINAKKMQKSTENAQYALNLMAKTIRTSEVEPLTTPGRSLHTFDYSRSAGGGRGCITYTINADGSIQVRVYNTTSATKLADCRGGSTTSYLTSIGTIIGSASYFASGNDKVSISLGVKVGSETINQIQTTVSIRNYLSY